MTSHVADMTSLERLDEATMLATLKGRLGEDEPYTYVSTVLIAMNPLKKLEGPEPKAFFDQSFDPSKPHPYALAELAYQRLDKGSQSIVVSGESGAGKTETSKMVTKYLTERSNGQRDLATKIVAMSPVLEAFGNASTHRNHNSSRFGRFCKLIFSPDEESSSSYDNKTTTSGNCTFRLIGGELETYLLEKSRVVRQSPGERNFHAMHMLLEERCEGDIKFRCMPYSRKESQKKTKAAHQKVGKALPSYSAVEEALGLIGQGSTTVWNSLNAVPCLADLEIKEPSIPGDVVTISSTYKKAAEFLGVKGDLVLDTLTTRSVKVRDEDVIVPRTKQETEAARDAAVRCVYGRIFEALVDQCNKVLCSDEEGEVFVGILDIFGFEIMAVNTLEQLLINYANEALQQLFCDSIFEAELDLYKQEGIAADLKNLTPPSSKPTLELLIGRQKGILRVLDAQCGSGGNEKMADRDAAFLASVHRDHSKDPNFGKTPPLRQRNDFAVIHYASKVEYTVIEQEVESWVSTNLDAVPDGLLHTLATSKDIFVQSFSQRGVTTTTGDVTGALSKQGRKLKTISARFTSSMSALSNTLTATDCGFVRCVKPTPKMVPNLVDDSYVLEQLRALGVVAATKVLQVGLPHRVEYSELLQSLPKSARDSLQGEPSELIVACTMSAFDVPADDYKLGLTRVFFPASAMKRVNKVLNFDPHSDPAKALKIEQKLVKLKQAAKQAKTAVSAAKTNYEKTLACSNQARALPIPSDFNQEEVTQQKNNEDFESLTQSHLNRAVDAAKLARSECERVSCRDAESFATQAEEKAQLAQSLTKELAELAAVKRQRDSQLRNGRLKAQAMKEKCLLTEKASKEAKSHYREAELASRRLDVAAVQAATSKSAKSLSDASQALSQAQALSDELLSLPTAVSLNEDDGALRREEELAGQVEQLADEAESLLSKAQEAVESEKKAELERQKLAAEAEAKKREEAKKRKEEEERVLAAAAAAAATIKKPTTPLKTTDQEVETPAGSPLDSTLPPLEEQVEKAKLELRKRLSQPEESEEESDDDDNVPAELDRTRFPGVVCANLRQFKRWFALELPNGDETLPPTPAGVEERKRLSEPASPPSQAVCHSHLRDMIYRGIHEIPLDPSKTSSDRPCLLQCIVKRSKGSMVSSHQYELFLTADPDTLLLTAKRPTTSPAYGIYDASRKLRGRVKDSGLEDPQPRKTASDVALFGHQRALKGGAPREIGVLLAPLSQKSIRPLLAASTDEFHPHIPVLIQRDPAKRDGKYSLDFKGRGKVASVKNFQLVSTGPDAALNDPTILQFCKVSANRFHLDFAPPFTPLTAFALAVSTCLS